MIKKRINSLELLHCGHYPDCQSVISKRFDDYLGIQFMQRGRVELFYGNKKYLLNGSWFWFTRPGVFIRYHKQQTCEKWNHHYLAVSGSLVTHWIESPLCNLPPVACPKEEMPRVVSLFNHIRKNFLTASHHDKLRKINQIENLLLDIQQYRFGSKLDSLGEMVDQRLRQNNFHNIDYHSLANEMGMSESTFRRQFKQRNGKPVHAHLQLLRIQEAKRIISDNPSLPLAAVAEKCGYCDEYYFSRHFREHTGMSPGRYRLVSTQSSTEPDPAA